MGVLYVPDRVTELLRTLESRFELVWATGWEDRANYELRSLIGLRQDLPVVTFGRGSRYGSAEWKTKPISRHAGDRPAAWIDDNFGASHERWARNRKSPTLLVEVDSNSGLSEEHVQRLLDWADEVQPEEATAGARHAG
jgi:hypothetical protein